MKLILLTWNFPPAVGGMEIMIAHLFEGLRQRGHTVEAVTAWADNPPPMAGVHRAPRRGVPAYLFFCLRRGWHLCRTLRPDLILCGSLLSAPLGWLLARIFRCPWGCPLYGSDLATGGRVQRWIARLLLRRADILLPISRFTADLAERRGADPTRCVIIPPGVASAPFDRPPTSGAESIITACQGRRVLITVGRLVRRKGVLEFVRNVMPSLVREIPDLLFLIVGDDGSQSLIHNKEGMRQQIEAAIREHQLEEHVRVLGKRPDAELLRLYFNAHVFVLPVLELPGDIEGFGIVFLEAGLAGVPSVATATGGIPDAIVDGQTGLLVPPGDTAALQSAVLRLLQDDDLRQRLGQQAANRARHELNWDNIIDRYEAALAGVVHQS